MRFINTAGTSLLVLLTFFGSAAATDVTPSQDYGPEEVVEIVIKALQRNDVEDNGIKTVFRFASPGNRANTGPLERFTGMIKRGFPDMLNHLGSRFGDIVVDGNTAMQTVWLTTANGSEVGYVFQLGKQSGGEYDGLWMTDAVFPLPGKRQSI